MSKSKEYWGGGEDCEIKLLPLRSWYLVDTAPRAIYPSFCGLCRSGPYQKTLTRAMLSSYGMMADAGVPMP